MVACICSLQTGQQPHLSGASRFIIEFALSDTLLAKVDKAVASCDIGDILQHAGQVVAIGGAAVAGQVCLQPQAWFDLALDLANHDIN